MRLLRTGFIVAILSLTVVVVAKPLKMTKARDVPVDLYLTQKAKIACPAGWYVFKSSDCPGYDAVGDLSINAIFLGATQNAGRAHVIAGACCYPEQSGSDLLNRFGVLYQDWYGWCTMDTEDYVHVSKEACKLRRLNGGSYKAMFYTFYLGRSTSKPYSYLVLCIGDKTKFGPDCRYQGLGVKPIYYLKLSRDESYWPSRKKLAKQIISSFVVP